jgi:dTDP-4-dehydrorhamnose reductase
MGLGMSLKVLVTGASGTVGRALSAYLEKQKCIVIKWNRTAVPVDDEEQSLAFLQRSKPDIFYHLAIASKPNPNGPDADFVNSEWPKRLADYCARLNIRFVYVSTVMVFTSEKNGPYKADSEPNAKDGYGLMKRQAEQGVLFANPMASVARIGWQIGQSRGSNNMIDFLENEMDNHGVIKTSDLWLPACSFVEDTAQMLYQLHQQEPAVYHIDSNHHWNFFEIVSALKETLGFEWKIERRSDFKYDQRMFDYRLQTPVLSTRLQQLRGENA